MNFMMLFGKNTIGKVSKMSVAHSSLIIALKEYDLAPGQSDVEFWVAIDDATEFRQELRDM